MDMAVIEQKVFLCAALFLFFKRCDSVPAVATFLATTNSVSNRGTGGECDEIPTATLSARSQPTAYVRFLVFV